MEGDVKQDLDNRDGNILSIEASYKFEECPGIFLNGLGMVLNGMNLSIIRLDWSRNI